MRGRDKIEAGPTKKGNGSTARDGESGSREGSTPYSASQEEELIESFEIWDEGWYVESEEW